MFQSRSFRKRQTVEFVYESFSHQKFGEIVQLIADKLLQLS